MSQSKRDKLSDVFNRSESILAPKTSSFEKAYPSISKLYVEIIESEGAFDPGSRTTTFTENNFNHVVNCSNPICYGGGVEVVWFIHDMVSSKKTEDSGYKHCKGYEGSPKGAKRYRSCAHSFRMKAKIEYKPVTDEPS